MTDPIATALNELVPAFPSAAGDWQAILRTAARPAAVVSAPRPRRRRWRSRRVLLATALVATTAVGVAAVAAGLGAFNGIGAVQHPQTPSDVIDPATAAYMEDKNCNGPGEHACQGMIVGLQFDTARHLGRLPDGQNIYVLSCAHDNLCTVVGPPHPTWNVSSPLSKSHPSTIFSYLVTDDNDPAEKRWFTFGVALDGVTSISFQSYEAWGSAAAGPQVTVPVKANFWVYEGKRMPSVLQPVTAHFADGTSVTMPATGENCAAC